MTEARKCVRKMALFYLGHFWPNFRSKLRKFPKNFRKNAKIFIFDFLKSLIAISKNSWDKLHSQGYPRAISNFASRNSGKNRAKSAIFGANFFEIRGENGSPAAIHFTVQVFLRKTCGSFCLRQKLVAKVRSV